MQKNDQSKNSFDELVAGISAEERVFLLEKIKQSISDTQVQIPVEIEENDTRSIQMRLNQESLLYRFILWVRSIFSGQPTQVIYNNDIVSSTANKINRFHPGLIDFYEKVLCSAFLEKLKVLQIYASFFKPYISVAIENPSEFYVFLSTFVAPEIAENINNNADPYSISFDRPITNELRTSLTRKLDASFRDISNDSKNNMYEAVLSVEWLRQFVAMPYLHFIAQFTNIDSSSFTCPFTNAQSDFDIFSKVLSTPVQIYNETLEALFFFVQRKTSKRLSLDATNEKALKDFLKDAITNISDIQMFMATVPVAQLGKVIYNDCTWAPEVFGGAEDWSIRFRSQWKQIFDERWNDWLRDRKKYQLSDVLKTQFNLSEFPELPYRPWASLWGGIQFNCEMTSGFLSWFFRNKYSDVISILNTIMVEGIFVKNENRTEFSEAVNKLSSVSQRILSFEQSISLRGQAGIIFDSAEADHTHSLQNQSRIEAIMIALESEIHEDRKLFCDACRTIENIFTGIFEGTKEKTYETLQNLMTIQGRENQSFREKMLEVRATLKNSYQLLAEIEVLDLPRQLS